MTPAELHEIIFSTDKINLEQYRKLLIKIRNECYKSASEAFDIDDMLGLRYYNGGAKSLNTAITLIGRIKLEPTYLTTDEITFLYSVIQHLNAKGTFTIEGNNVTLRYKAKGQHEITTHFDKNLLEKYYNRPCSFITEVL